MPNTELQEIKEGLSKIGGYIPTEMADWVWNNYKKLSGSIEQRPCNCGSAAGHWRRAVDFLTDWVKQNDINA